MNTVAATKMATRGQHSFGAPTREVWTESIVGCDFGEIFECFVSFEAKNEDGSSADKDEKPSEDTQAEASGEKEKPSQESSPSAERSTDKETTESKDAGSAPPAAGGAYVPPALRRAMQGGGAPAAAPAAPAESKPAEGSATASKYLPPHLRAKAGGDSSSSSSSGSNSAIPSTSVNFNRNRPNKSQPNIMDTMEFPTLDAVGATEGAPEKAVNGGDK